MRVGGSVTALGQKHFAGAIIQQNKQITQEKGGGASQLGSWAIMDQENEIHA
jgi:hypothetical protein